MNKFLNLYIEVDKSLKISFLVINYLASGERRLYRDIIRVNYIASIIIYSYYIKSYYRSLSYYLIIIIKIL